ncbi:NADH-ubiquinone oxidoreductase chain 5 [Platanthera zijinensis]|uniref:NADH-ubiquinone oxidoreductase chain 5 n=1 Tax=Platanthera zijinensis TaxID=2320716 RepID=A0AAP0BGG9_9ASPA
MLMGSLSLIGFPFPTGFYSKDVILELAYTNSFGRDRLRCHDAPIPMTIPFILLALGSLFVGYLAKV